MIAGPAARMSMYNTGRKGEMVPEMDASKITLVCCYNKPEQYQALCDSLATQTEPYMLLGVDNRQQTYDACSKALNAAVRQVTTQYVAFAHQDIVFTSPAQLTQLVSYLERIALHDLLGVAGSRFDSKDTISNVYRQDGQSQYGAARVTDMELCDTVDECFIAGSTQHFLEFPFDEEICNGWHLYAVEACLNAKRAGNNIYLCDLPLIHQSGGNPDREFYRCFCRLCKEYNKQVPYLRTTCAHAYTHLLGRVWKRIEGELRCTAVGKKLRTWVRKLRNQQD